jgi:methylamine utilization protein MauE
MDPLLELMIAWSLAALFAASTLHKLLALSEWPGVLRNYRLMPDVLSGAAAWLILSGMALTAGALLWQPTRRLGAVTACLLLIIFGAAMGINIRRGRTAIDCGCFGSRLRQGIARWMVMRNGFLALCALTLLLPVHDRELSALEIAVIAGLLVTLTFLYPVVAVVCQPRLPTYEENHGATAIDGRR